MSAGSGLKHDVVQAITKELRKILGLTLFGYDTVVQEGTGELVLCPINITTFSPSVYSYLAVHIVSKSCAD